MKHLTTLALVGAVGLLGACERERTTGRGEKKLTLSKPDAVEIRRGGTALVDIDVKRKNIRGDVTIAFDGLPRGVEVAETSRRIMGDHGTFTLRAADDAELADGRRCSVTASAGGVTVTEQFDLTVLDHDTTVGLR